MRQRPNSLVWARWAPCALALLVGACGAPERRTAAACPALACQTSLGPDATGACRYAAKGDGTSCTSGNGCLHDEICTAGSCGGGVPFPDGTPCNDQNACTRNDICQQGVCAGTEAVICPAADACRGAATCDPSLGCPDTTLPACAQNLPAVSLGGCSGSGYTLPVVLGGKDYTFLLDTASSSTAVAAANCSNCSISPNYAPATNAAAYGGASTSYGDGSGWLGSIYAEPVAVQTADGMALHTPVPLYFAAITRQQNNFFGGTTCAGAVDRQAWQGILGLGSTAGASAGTSGYLDVVANANLVPYDAFTLQLCDVGGRFWLGGYDPSTLATRPLFSPLIPQSNAANHYAVSLTNVVVGSTALQVAVNAQGPAYLDSATSASFLSAATYQAFVATLQKSSAFTNAFGADLYGGGTTVCSSRQGTTQPDALNALLPRLTLTFAAGSGQTPVSLSLGATQSYLTPYVQSQNGTDKFVYCTSLYPGSITLLGASMMRGLAFIFDRDNAQIGFAPQQGCTATFPRLPAM